jgi:hypothetical protein
MSIRARAAELAALQLDIVETMAREREAAIRGLASRVGRVTAESWVNDALEDELAGQRGIMKLHKQRDILGRLLRDSFRRLGAWQPQAKEVA